MLQLDEVTAFSGVGAYTGIVRVPQLAHISTEGGSCVSEVDNPWCFSPGLYQAHPGQWRYTITPDDSAPAPALRLSRSTVPGCQSVIGRVQLANPAPGGGRVVSLSDTLLHATTPASVTVPGGATIIAFTITTTPVPTLESGTITANFGGTLRTQNLSVRRIGMRSVVLDSNYGGRNEHSRRHGQA